MSSGNLTVTFEDGLVLYGEYHLTVDLAYPNLFTSEREVSAFHNKSVKEKCLIEIEDKVLKLEPVKLYTDYGGGITWKGTADRTLKIIVNGCSPYPYDRFD